MAISKQSRYDNKGYRADGNHYYLCSTVSLISHPDSRFNSMIYCRGVTQDPTHVQSCCRAEVCVYLLGDPTAIDDFGGCSERRTARTAGHISKPHFSSLISPLSFPFFFHLALVLSIYLSLSLSLSLSSPDG